MPTNTQNLLLAIAAVGALALLLQTLFVIALLVLARKAVKHVEEEMRHYHSIVTPLILKTRDLVENIAPQLKDTANDLTVITRRLREQTAEIQTAANDIIDRTRYQANRVDNMITSVFDRVERASVFVSDTVSKPVRQLTGIIASVRAAVETFIEPHSSHHSPAPQSGASRYSDGENIPEPRTTGTTAGYGS
jgi:methyl-accepting chemotaxis protein